MGDNLVCPCQSNPDAGRGKKLNKSQADRQEGRKEGGGKGYHTRAPRRRRRSRRASGGSGSCGRPSAAWWPRHSRRRRFPPRIPAYPSPPPPFVSRFGSERVSQSKAVNLDRAISCWSWARNGRAVGACAEGVREEMSRAEHVGIVFLCVLRSGVVAQLYK